MDIEYVDNGYTKTMLAIDDKNSTVTISMYYYIRTSYNFIKSIKSFLFEAKHLKFVCTINYAV